MSLHFLFPSTLAGTPVGENPFLVPYAHDFGLYVRVERLACWTDWELVAAACGFGPLTFALGADGLVTEKADGGQRDEIEDGVRKVLFDSGESSSERVMVLRTVTQILCHQVDVYLYINFLNP